MTSKTDKTDMGGTSTRSRGRYIAIAGNMGVGKSTFVDFLTVRFGVMPFFEPNEMNPYLVDFYSDMRRWAFASQMYFLQKKFAIHLSLQAQSGVVVQDRTIYEDAEIFARNLYRSRLLSKRDWNTYWELYESILSQLRPPDLLVYLRCPVRTIRNRIKLRARDEEQEVSTSYLRKLNERYEQWIESYDLSPIVTIETDRLDYISDLVCQLELLQTIEKYLA